MMSSGPEGMGVAEALPRLVAEALGLVGAAVVAALDTARLREALAWATATGLPPPHAVASRRTVASPKPGRRSVSTLPPS